MFVIVVLIGLPVALAIAWTAVPHPHPRKRDAPVQTTHTDRVLLALLGAVVLLSRAQFAYEFWHQPSESQSGATASGATAAENRRNRD